MIRKVCFTFLIILLSSAYPDQGFAKGGKFLKMVNDFIEAFNDYDTTYIEPNHYNFAAMIQGTQSMERYRLKSEDVSVTLGPDLNPRVGPYFGWRWLFLGYTLDVNLGRLSGDRKSRKDFSASLYTSLFGVDIFFRQTGNYYRIKSLEIGSGIDTRCLYNIPFSGVDVGISGFNLHFVANSKKFSYPAAYSQSTQQKRSAGSIIAGIGYTRHSMNYDNTKMDTLLSEYNIDPLILDSAFRVKKVKYTDINFSVGYSYNWVFAKNCLFNASLSAALAIDRATGEYENKNDRKWFQRVFFSLDDLNIDGTGRFGLVYNNGRWFAGASAILHTYTYRREHFSTLNIFGDMNLYFGFNFQRRKK